MNRRGEYQKFDNISNQMREPVIILYAEKVIAHAAANGRSCRQGFVKEQVDGVAVVAPLMKITHDNINNNVRAIQYLCKKPEVMPVVPYHVIRFICFL